ncbi:annexin A13-like [Mizuhopecten yessoensis]|uniref:Annexin n=1 Tax=Mizuhopecten yessoensis TaxID=6573 RepID=A0A210PV56_MIZYE|nr:annexin A13-like [Mizuhopecten yessoensis]XP_021374535.1 annexin A13-like [Mizuhopecten yessoensis]OWF40346.1 Annexin A7 [Mizuhopecten yessoensis]
MAYYGNPYQSNYYGGGFTYANPAYQVNSGFPPPQQMMMNPFAGMPCQMQMMPPTIQTNITINTTWSTDNCFLDLAEEAGLADEDDEEDEEEYEEDEEEEEEVKKSRRKIRKKAKKKAKIAEKIAGLSDEQRADLKSRYVARLKDHLDKYNSLEPTTGTVKTYTKYQEDDPVVVFMQEFDGTSAGGERWDSEYDCIYLDAAMDGLGTNEDAIIHVITARTNSQRQELKKKFKTAYGTDLVERLKSELSGNLKECVMALFVSPEEYDAWCVRNAIYGLGTDDSVLCEIMFSRTNPQIKAMVEAYKDVAFPDLKAPENALEEDIEGDTSGDYKRLLISASQGNRDIIDLGSLEEAVEEVKNELDMPTGMFAVNHDKLVNVGRAERDAKKLFEAGQDSWGTDEETFNRIFSIRDPYQLRRTYSEYVKLSQCDIENAVDDETSGDFKMALYTLVMCIKFPPRYFAKRLIMTMKGLGTADSDLIRIIVSRSEIDMEQIKAAFLEETKQTLWNWINDDCSGDYKKLLQGIVGRD